MSVLYSKIVVGVLCFVAILMSISVYNRFIVATDMRIKLETKRAVLEELKMRAQALESKVEYLENERGIEEELRNRFDVIREGEQVVVLLERKSGVTNQASTTFQPDGAVTEKNKQRSPFFSIFKFW